MATKEDLKSPPASGGTSSGAPGSEAPPPADEGSRVEELAAADGSDAEATVDEHDVVPVGVASPSQLGTGRFVYAAYFAGAIAIAFMVSKLLDFAWYKAQTVKPVIGEPRDEIVMPVSAVIGSLVAVYCWYRTRTRQLADEVATEMSKVTWPDRDEVTSGTFVVIVTTVVSTVFFALMDKFWGFVSNLVYGGT